MATATLSNLKIRNRIAAAAELKRNGIPFAEMSSEDISNVEPLPVNEAVELFCALDEIDGEQTTTETGASYTRYNWPQDNYRWTLTPHQLQKFEQMDAHKRAEYRALAKRSK